MRTLLAIFAFVCAAGLFVAVAQDRNKTLHIDDSVNIDFDLKPKQSNTDKVELTFPVSNEARCFRLVGRSVDSIACPETDTLSKGCMEVDANGNLKISGCGTAACLTCDSSDVIFDRASETTFTGTKTWNGLPGNGMRLQATADRVIPIEPLKVWSKPALVGQDILDLYNKHPFDHTSPSKQLALDDVKCPKGTTLDGGDQIDYVYLPLQCYTAKGAKRAFENLLNLTSGTTTTVTGARAFGKKGHDE